MAFDFNVDDWEFDDNWWVSKSYSELYQVYTSIRDDDKRKRFFAKLQEKQSAEVLESPKEPKDSLAYMQLYNAGSDSGKSFSNAAEVESNIDDEIFSLEGKTDKNFKDIITLRMLREARYLHDIVEAKFPDGSVPERDLESVCDKDEKDIEKSNKEVSTALKAKTNATIENYNAIREAKEVDEYIMREVDSEAIDTFYANLIKNCGFEVKDQEDIHEITTVRAVVNNKQLVDNEKDLKIEDINNANPLYIGCFDVLRRTTIEYDFDKATSDDEKKDLTTELNRSLMANAAHRAAQKLLTDKNLYKNKTPEQLSKEYGRVITEEFKRSLILSALAGSEATAVFSEAIVIENGELKYDGRYDDKKTGEVVAEINRIIEAVNNGNIGGEPLKISPFAVKMDGDILDIETKKFAKETGLKVPGKLTFWDKTKKLYQVVKGNLFTIENAKKFGLGMLVMGGATAAMASSSAAIIAAGAAVYAGWTIANAWIMPALKKEKDSKLSLEALQEKWKDKEFTRGAWLRTAEGLSVGGILAFMGPALGAAKALKHTVRGGIIATFKGLPTLFSRRKYNTTKEKLTKRRSIETHKALQLYAARYKRDEMNLYSGVVGYVFGVAIAESGVLQSITNSDFVKGADQWVEDLKDQCKSYLNIDSDISAQTNLNDVSDTDVRAAEIEANKAAFRNMMGSFNQPGEGAQELTDTLQQGSRDSIGLQQYSRDTLDLQQGSRDSVVMQQSQDSLQMAEFQQEDEAVAQAQEAAAQAQAATPETLEINGKTYTVIGEPKEMGNGVRAVYLKNADGEPFVQYEGLKGGLWSEEQALARANLLANVNKHNPNFTFSDGSTVETNIEIMKERIEEGYVTLPEGMHENQAIYLAMMKARYLGDDSLLKALQCNDVDLTKELTELSNKFSVNGEIGTLITEEPLRMSVGATTKLDPSCMPTSDINYSGGQNTEILDASKTTIDTDAAERQLDMKAAVDGEVKSPEVYSSSRNDTALDSETADGEAFRYDKKTDEYHGWDKDGAKTNIIDENGNTIETGLKEHGRNGIEFYTQNPAPEAVNELIRELPKPQYVSIEEGTATYVFEYEKGQVELKLTYPDANGVEHGTLVVDGIEVPLNQEGCKALAERMTEVTGQKFTSVDGPEQDATHNITVKDRLVEKRAEHWDKVIKRMGEGIDGNGAGAEDIAGSSLKFVHEQVTLTPELKQAIQENGEFAFVKFNDDGRAILRVAGVDGVSEIAVQAPVSIPVDENSAISVDINKETGAYEAVINAGDHEIKISDTHQYNSDTNEWNDVVVTVDGQQALLDSKTAGAVETMVEKALLEKHIEADVNLHQPASFSQKVVAAIETGQNKAGLSRAVMRQMSAYNNK